jgi:hypothetical protein
MSATVVAVWAFGLAAYAPGVYGALCALGGLGVLGWGARVGGGAGTPPLVAVGWLAVPFVALGVVAPNVPPWGAAAPAASGSAICGAGALALVWLARRARAGPRPSGGIDGAALGVVAVVVSLGLAVTGAVAVRAMAGVGDDVLWLHDDAAAALTGGHNPYGASVDVADGSFLAAPGARIVGYPYPPPTALAYALGRLVFGDARFTSLLAFVGLVAALGVRAARIKPTTRATELAAVGLMLASVPAWPRVLAEAWTEPLSLALLGAAALAWRRPVVSSLALGVGLASKQYFLLAAPCVALALLGESRGRLRLLVTAGAVAASILPAVLVDPGAFHRAAIAFHLGRPPRPESTGLAWLLCRLWPSGAWAAPLGVATLVLCWLGGAALARRAPAGRGPWASMALVLGVGFLLSPQAFSNYWFLEAGLAALAFLTSHEASDEASHEASDEASDEDLHRLPAERAAIRR